MILDSFLAFFGANKIHDGKVVDKISYSASQQVAVDEHGHVTKLPADVDTWSLVVEGKGVFGSVVKQQEIVSEMEFNNTQVGDAWPGVTKWA